MEKVYLIGTINLAGPLDIFKNISKKIDLEDPNHKIPLPNHETQNIFSPCSVNLTTDLLRKYQNLDAFIGYMKS